MRKVITILSLLFVVVKFLLAQNAPEAINHASNRHNSGHTNYRQKNSGGHYLGGQRPDSRKDTHYQNTTGTKGYLGNESRRKTKKK
jgi:hypothetical protein